MGRLQGQWRGGAWLVAMALVAGGCEAGKSKPDREEDDDGSKKKREKRQEDDDGEAADEGEKSPHWGVIPDIPTEAQPRPAKEAFADAEPINTAPEAHRANQCTMKIVGQWLQVHCSTSFMTTVREGDWGEAGKDYMAGNPLYVRLRPGTLQRGFLTGGASSSVTLTTAWFEGDPKPWTIALEDKQKTMAGPQKEAAALADIAWTPAGEHPAEAEWVRGTPINSAPLAERPDWCRMLYVAGWLQLTCASGGGSKGLVLLEGFGTAGKDYFRQTTFAGTQLEVPLKPGHAYKANVTNYGERKATLEVAWPDGADAPAKVALAK